jgi:predicted GIY-YIG superfamily endonuclease
MKTRLERDQQQMSQGVYRIPCECGKSYIGKTGRPLAMRLREHRYNLKEGHRVSRDETRILEIESNSRYRK